MALLSARLPAVRSWPSRLSPMGETVAVAARALLASFASRTATALVVAWRSLLVLVMVMRLGVGWRLFCERTMIAQRKTIGRGDRAKTVVRGVPGLGRWRATQHGVTTRLRLCPGQDLATLDGAMSPLRHTLHVQSAKVHEIENRPGYLQLTLLRRDPLDRVRMTPRPVGPDRFVLGLTETGADYVLDFEANPHILTAGATGSGKSGWLLALESAMASTDDVLVGWDLKWGLENSVMAARFSTVCENRNQVRDSAEVLLRLAESRAHLLKQLGCRSVHELADRHGVQLRRVRVVVDEVAELALDAGTELEADATAKEVLSQILRIVQLVRALGINVVLCGQRFGSDMGKLITSIRAQVSGRVCLRVNDRESAMMTLPGMDDEVHHVAMGLTRPGLGVIKLSGTEWYLARTPYLSYDVAQVTAQKHAHKAIGLDQLDDDDHQRVQHLLTTSA
jgi:S-DNA-T family DNA segregation ATPase FtsK/SpoIIIE